MKRITISLPDDLAARVERAARRDRTSVSDVVRRSLAAQLGASSTDGKRRLAFAALGRGGSATLSEDIEDILREEWGGIRNR